MPACAIEPSDLFTKGLQRPAPKGGQFAAGLRGSRLGTIQGLTHRGSTGVMVPVGPLPTAPELEGLNASAVAVALTLLPERPQMREKNVGKAERETSTVT